MKIGDSKDRVPDLPDGLRKKLVWKLRAPDLRELWPAFAATEDEVVYDFYQDKYPVAMAAFPGKRDVGNWLCLSLWWYVRNRWRSLHRSHDQPDGTRIWIRREFSVGENSKLETLEAQHQEPAHASALSQGSNILEDDEATEAQRRQAVDCFSRLTRPDQELVKQHVLKGELLVDIARREDLKDGTVRARFQRAIVRMKDCIQGRLRKPGRPRGSTSTRK